MDPELTLVDVVAVRQLLEQGDDLGPSPACLGGADECCARCRPCSKGIIDEIEDFYTSDGFT